MKNTVKVIWNDLESWQQELVIALFNNQGDPVRDGKQSAGERSGRGFSLWTECIPVHPCMEEGDGQICDPYAAIKKGHMVISGQSEFHGEGKKRTAILPLDVEIGIGASVSR